MALSTTNGNTSFAATSSAERLRYFLGQLLGQRDLQSEQRYHIMLRRLLQREVFGTGTVAGLEVTRVPASPPGSGSILLEPGLAMDPDGRELLLERDLQVDLALPAAQEPDNSSLPPPSLPDDEDKLATTINSHFGASSNPITGTQVTGLIDRLVAAKLIVATNNAGKLAEARVVIGTIRNHSPGVGGAELAGWIYDQLVGETHIGLQYREDGGDPSPAVRDASCCAGVTCFPTRTVQGVAVAASATPFPIVADPFGDLLTKVGSLPRTPAGGYDCAEIKRKVADAALDMWRSIPSVTDACGEADFPLLPLAKVCWSQYNRPGNRILSIDNTSERLLALGVPMVRAIVGGLLGCVPGGY